MSNEIAIRETAPDLVAVAGQIMKVNKRSRQTYGYYMQSFKNYCDKKGISADFDAITQWLDSFENSNTKAVALASVKAVLGQLYKRDPRLLILKQELDEIKPVKKYTAITRAHYLTKPEIDDLIKKSPPRIALIIEALFWTGLRCTEIASIKLENCTLVEKVYEIKVVGKGNKENICFLSKKFFEKCRKFFDGKVYLFEHKGKQYSREHLTREIAKAGDLIGKNISAHVIRHSTACFLRDDRKLSIDKISRALNHSSISTTAGFYLHGAPDAKERGIV